MQEGLKELKRQCEVIEQNKPIKAIVIPLYSFIGHLIASLRTHILQKKSMSVWTWLQFMSSQHSANFSLLNIERFKHSMQAAGNNINPRVCNANYSLPSYSTTTKHLRKCLCQMGNAQHLDQITLKHEHVITVVHRVFQHPTVKKEIIEGLKRLFISFRIVDAKIYSCVFIQYILTHINLISELEAGHANKSCDSNRTENMSASFSSTIHKENGLYRKVANLNLLSRVIETKFVSKIRLSQPNGLLFHSNETSEPELSEVHSHSSNGANQSQMATKMRKLSQSSLSSQQSGFGVTILTSNYTAIKEPNNSPPRQRSRITEPILVQQNNQFDQQLSKKELLNNNIPNIISNSLSLLGKQSQSRKGNTVKNSDVHRGKRSEDISTNKRAPLPEDNTQSDKFSSLQRMAERNKEFKERMLSYKQNNVTISIEGQFDSITSTMHIIHNSIVRNRRNHQDFDN